MPNIIYSMKGCHYCDLARELFQRADIDYVEMKLDSDFTIEEIKETLQKETVTFPQIIFEGRNVGGLVDAAKLFQQRGLV
jgi:glutaredoxin